jgi:hypothetical protein
MFLLNVGELLWTIWRQITEENTFYLEIISEHLFQELSKTK